MAAACSAWLVWEETVAVGGVWVAGDSENAVGEENEGGEQLLEAEGVEEGPGEEYEVVEMEETVTA